MSQLKDIKDTLKAAGIKFAAARATGPNHYEIVPKSNNEGAICECLTDAGFFTSIYPSTSQDTNLVSVLDR